MSLGMTQGSLISSAAITTIFSMVLDADDGGYGTWSFRNFITITGGAGAGGQIRVTFAASSSGGLDANHCSIGISSALIAPPNPGDEDATAVPVNLLFSGGATFSLSAGQTIVSDWASLSGFTSANFLLPTIDIGTNGEFRIKGGNPSNLYRAFYNIGPAANYNQQNIVPSGDITNAVYGISKIEVQ